MSSESAQHRRNNLNDIVRWVELMNNACKLRNKKEVSLALAHPRVSTQDGFRMQHTPFNLGEEPSEDVMQMLSMDGTSVVISSDQAHLNISLDTSPKEIDATLERALSYVEIFETVLLQGMPNALIDESISKGSVRQVSAIISGEPSQHPVGLKDNQIVILKKDGTWHSLATDLDPTLVYMVVTFNGSNDQMMVNMSDREHVCTVLQALLDVPTSTEITYHHVQEILANVMTSDIKGKKHPLLVVLLVLYLSNGEATYMKVGMTQLTFRLKPNDAIFKEKNRHMMQDRVKMLTPEKIRDIINHAQLRIEIDGKLVFDWFQPGDFKAFGGEKAMSFATILNPSIILFRHNPKDPLSLHEQELLGLGNVPIEGETLLDPKKFSPAFAQWELLQCRSDRYGQKKHASPLGTLLQALAVMGCEGKPVPIVLTKRNGKLVAVGNNSSHAIPMKPGPT